MTQTASGLWDETLDADRLVPDPEADELLVGGVDMHTHPGPSPFPRRMSILEAATDAATVGFRAIVCKSHHVRHEALIVPNGGEMTPSAACRSRPLKLRAA